MDEELLQKRQISFFYFINKAEPPEKYESKVKIYKESCCECCVCQFIKYCWQ
jgi:hypothetical protein